MCVYVCIYVCLYVFIETYWAGQGIIYIYTHTQFTHTHTYIHTYTHTQENVSIPRATLGDFLRSKDSDLAWYCDDGKNHSIRGLRTPEEDDDVVFCSWNNVYKADPDTLNAW